MDHGRYRATERGARTITVDPKTHRAYLLAAEFGPAPEGKKGRPPVLPDSFHVIVVGNRRARVDQRSLTESFRPAR